MNNTTIDTDRLLFLINNEKTQLLLPAIIYISVLMVTGLLGNTMVCYFYGLQAKTTPSTIFIVYLGIYDLTVCCIFMPTEIVNLVKFYTFENGPACKVLRFVNFFTGIGSILTLLAIAVDRYKHIHKASGQQITLQGTKVICVLVAVVAVLLSWPSLLIYDALPIDVPNKYGITLNGSNCMLTDQSSYRPYVWAFNAVQFLCFIIFTTVLVVLYGIVGKTIYRHRKTMSKYKSPISATIEQENSTRVMMTIEESTNSQTDVNVITLRRTRSEPSLKAAHNKDTSFSSTDKTSKQPAYSDLRNNHNHIENAHHHGYQDKQYRESYDLTKIQGPKDDIEHNTVIPRQMRRKSQSIRPISKGQGRDTLRFDRDTVQVTLVMIAVTVLFIISLLPYLCLTVWRIYEGKHEAEFLSDAGLVAFKIGSRSYLLNSSLNPWIYGVFNGKFRHFYYNKFCCRAN